MFVIRSETLYNKLSFPQRLLLGVVSPSPRSLLLDFLIVRAFFLLIHLQFILYTIDRLIDFLTSRCFALHRDFAFNNGRIEPNDLLREEVLITLLTFFNKLFTYIERFFFELSPTRKSLLSIDASCVRQHKTWHSFVKDILCDLTEMLKIVC